MSGVLRRGSLSFELAANTATSKRGSMDANLYGGYREQKPTARTPELSVIALDFRRHSEDLRKEQLKAAVFEQEQHFGIDNPDGLKDLSKDVDSDIISNYLGHYSFWSFFWTFLLCMFQLPTTFHMFMFVFQSVDKDFWCERPEHLQHVDVDSWKNATHTSNGCNILNVDFQDVNYVNGSWLGLPTDSLSDYNNCEKFEYAIGGGRTLVEEFGLVCERRKLLSVVEMCFLAGAAVGSVSSGWLSDRFGRKHTLMVFATVQTLFGGLLAFVTSMAVFMTLRVIIGFASMTVTIVSFVLVVELVSGKWRTIIGILNILPVAISYVLAAAIAYVIRDWRILQLVISWPFVALLCIWYWLPESPRWLLARGRLDELCAVIESAARMNRTTLPANYRKSLEAAVPTTVKFVANVETATTTTTTATTTTEPSSNATAVNAESCSNNPLVVVFSSAYWRTTCLTLIVWLTLIIIYFGLTLHLSNLGGNIYINTAIAGTVEAISICISIFVVLKFGIRHSLVVYMLVPGICCLATNIVPQGDGSQESIAVIALAMIAKCLIGANNAIIPTFTAMQYPTVVRNFGVGMGNLAAGVALILVPYLWLLEHVEPLLPLSIMGVCGLVGAVALALMKDVE